MFDENSNGNFMALANHLLNVKDSRWLQVEVCREFQRGQCSRTELECKFAHPPPYVEVQNGRVTACYDSIKGRCSRENPKCKYLHPPQHLKDQLLINGRNNLAVKNLLINSFPWAYSNPLNVQSQQLINPGTALSLPGAGVAAMPGAGTLAYPYYAATALNPAAAVYSPGLIPAASSPDIQNMQGFTLPAGPAQSPASLAASAAVQQAQQKARPDRVETVPGQNNAMAALAVSRGWQAMAAVHAVASHSSVAASMAQSPPVMAPAASTHHLSKKRPLEPDTTASFAYQMAVPGDPSSLLLAAAALQQQQQQQLQAASAVKRVAVEKSGVPVYQPAMPAISPAFQYPTQFTTIPGLGPAYIPVTFPVTGVGSVPGAAAPAPSPSSHLAALPGTRCPTNAASVAYFDESGQLLDTLPVCRDFKQGHCERPNCRYVHLLEDYVEVHDGKVTVCRDFAKGKCSRAMCKYYHVPILPGSVLLNRLMAPASPGLRMGGESMAAALTLFGGAADQYPLYVSSGAVATQPS